MPNPILNPSLKKIVCKVGLGIGTYLGGREDDGGDGYGPAWRGRADAGAAWGSGMRRRRARRRPSPPASPSPLPPLLYLSRARSPRVIRATTTTKPRTEKKDISASSAKMDGARWTGSWAPRSSDPTWPPNPSIKSQPDCSSRLRARVPSSFFRRRRRRRRQSNLISGLSLANCASDPRFCSFWEEIFSAFYSDFLCRVL
jgi:hypothetical protein